MPRDTTFAADNKPPVHNPDTDAALDLTAHPEHWRLKRVENLANWLDTKFHLPVVNYPVGLDGIIGLIPGVGDTVTTGLSGWLIYEAHQCGASKRTLATMGKNVALDWLYGLVPVIGDVIDFAHKANAKNAKLLAEELRAKHAHELTEKRSMRAG